LRGNPEARSHPREKMIAGLDILPAPRSGMLPHMRQQRRLAAFRLPDA
jgi:hypothetical protein